MTQTDRENRTAPDDPPRWKKVLIAVWGFGCLVLLFPGLVLVLSHPYIDFELSCFLWLFEAFGGEYTRISFDSAVLATSQGPFFVSISLFNSSVTFFCLFLVIGLLLRGVPAVRRAAALVPALPVLFFGGTVQFFFLYECMNLFGPFSLAVFDVIIGAFIAFVCIIISCIVFVFLLLPRTV